MAFPPPNLTIDHVRMAAERMTPGQRHPPDGAARHWAVLDGLRYAPASLLRLAASLAEGWAYDPADARGGDGPEQSTEILRGLGVEILDESAGDGGVPSSRSAFLLAWNPDRWSWTNYAADAIAVQAEESLELRWSIGSRKNLAAGSRLFLMRLGREPKGIIGSGYAVGDVYEHPHWDPARAKRGDIAPRTTIGFDHLLNAEVEPPFDPISCGVEVLEKFDKWRPQGGGVAMPPDVATALEDAWQRHLAATLRSPAAAIAPVDPQSQTLLVVGSHRVLQPPSGSRDARVGGTRVGSSNRRSPMAKAIGDRAEHLVKRHLEATLPPDLRATVRHHAADGKTPGYDLSYGDGKSLVAVEVKGSVQAVVGSIELTANEWRAAQDLGDRYHLYMVGGVHSNRPMLEVVENAAARLRVRPSVYTAHPIEQDRSGPSPPPGR
jgi:hypothetical protein